ncbi:MAG TPA: pilus assembly protein PilM [Planctomycetota bacterium]|nr:pilus assembly protein PilM [Planctomycetota bacterium]
MAANTVWGVDIGNSAIKAVKMTKLGTGECMITDFDIVDIPIGEDDKERNSRVQSALATLVKNHKFGSDQVYVSVAGNVCLHREFQLPPGSEDKLSDLVQYEAKQQIPFPLEQVEWGFERYEDPNGVGVALIAVRKNDIQDLMNMCKENNLNVRGITAAPMSLFNFIHFEFRPENTTLILDAGAKGTDFVVMNRRQVYFRTIQIAGREITRVLENKFKVTYDKAEDLKKNISKSPQLDKILAVIEPTLRQLGAEVQRTIGFWKSKARGQRIGQCYLLGHTFRLPKMAEYLQTQVREAPFALVEGLQRVKLHESINPDVWNNEFPTMAVAIGLGLQGLGLSELKLNLIPQTVKTTEAVNKWKPWVAASAALVLVTLGYSYSQAQASNAFYAKKLQEFDKVVADATKSDNEARSAISGLAEKRALTQRWARIAADRGKLTPIFASLAGLRGSDNKPFFGPDNKIFLTGLQVSRMPLSTPGWQPENPDRQKLATSSDALTGKSSLYTVMSPPDSEDPMLQPPETRVSVPLVAMLSGEVESGANALKTLAALEEILKKMPEVKDVRIETSEAGPAYFEEPIEYLYDGKLKTMEKASTPAPGAAPTGKKLQYRLFNVFLRWNDPNDPDVEPVKKSAAPAPAAAPKAGAKKDAKAPAK